MDQWQQELEDRVAELETSDGDPRAGVLAKVELAYEISLVEVARSDQLTAAGRAFAEKTGDDTVLARVLRNEGYRCMVSGRSREALSTLLEADKLAETLGDKAGQATAKHTLANLYEFIGSHDRAIEYAEASLRLSEELGDVRLQAWNYSIMGITRSEIGSLDSGREMFERAIALFREIDYEPGAGRTLNRLGVYLNEAGFPEEAMPILVEANQIFMEVRIPNATATTLADIGACLLKLGLLDDAIHHLKEAQKLADESPLRAFVADTSVKLALAFVKVGILDDARTELDNAWSIVENTDFRPIEMRIHRVEIDLAERCGNHDLALEHAKKLLDLREEQNKSERTVMARNFNIQREVELAEQRAENDRIRYEELEKEKRRSDTLLHAILPVSVANELKIKGRAEPTEFDDVTVLFTDFVGFTEIASRLSAADLVARLDSCFRRFDEIMSDWGLEPLKTIGDSYMAAGNLPEPLAHHPVQAALAALTLINEMTRMNEMLLAAGEPAWPLRLGLHSGPVVAGVIGQRKFAYDVWGDTVNLASRMESKGEPGKVNVSGHLRDRLAPFFVLEDRGQIEAKGVGKVRMAFVSRLKPEYCADGQGLIPSASLWTDLDQIELSASA